MNKALQYAEEKLGVHEVYERCTKSLEELDELLGDLDKAQDTRRQLAEEIADREAELLSDERGKHPDMSASGMDQHMKAAKRKDTYLAELRKKFNEAASEIQGLEYDLDLCKFTLRVNTARLEELGGYLHYLAAVKAEQNTKKNQPTRNPE